MDGFVDTIMEKHLTGIVTDKQQSKVNPNQLMNLLHIILIFETVDDTHAHHSSVISDKKEYVTKVMNKMSQTESRYTML